MDVLLISSQAGDWEALYVSREIVAEGHEVDRITLLEKSYEYNFTFRDIRFSEVKDEDEELLDKYGSFPYNIGELNHEY